MYFKNICQDFSDVRKLRFAQWHNYYSFSPICIFKKHIYYKKCISALIINGLNIAVITAEIINAKELYAACS